MTDVLMPAELFEIQRPGIGSADAPIIAGVSPYRTPGVPGLWQRKTGLVPEPPQTFAMRVGELVEPVLEQLVEERTGWDLRRVPGRTHRDPKLSWMTAHADRTRSGHRELVELKLTTRADRWGENGDPLGAPPDARVQVQHQLEVYDWRRGWIAALIVGRGYDLRVYPVERNARMIAGIIEAERHFQELVERREPPDLDGSEASAELLLRRYPRAEKFELIATAEDLLLLMELREATEARQGAELAEEKVKQRVKERMGSASALIGTVGDTRVRVTYGNVSASERTNWQAVAAAYRHLYRELRDAGDERPAEYSDEELEALTSLHSTTRAATRRFEAHWKEIAA